MVLQAKMYRDGAVRILFLFIYMLLLMIIAKTDAKKIDWSKGSGNKSSCKKRNTIIYWYS